jgi:hypothetical protein
MDSKWLIGGAIAALALSNTNQGGNTPEPKNPLTDTHCTSDGTCATLAIRNQNQSQTCLNLVCSEIRVRLTGDVKNIGDVEVQSATLRLELYDGNGNTVRTLRETVGALNTGESTQLNRTVEGSTLELQSIRNGGARLIIEDWS